MNGVIIMDVKKIAKDIDSLEKEVQQNTHTYIMESEYTSIVDSQLNGYAKVLISYCAINNLTTYSNALSTCLPIDGSAIEFFCIWDGLKSDIVSHSQALQGKLRQQMITDIAYELQSSMTKESIDAYLSGFSVAISDEYYTINSKRVYVQNTLKNVDGIIIFNIAKDLHLISPDVISTDIENLSTSDFVSQQIAKCKSKMNTEDFDGAITNARTLVEEILLSIEEQIQGSRQPYDGNLPSLYKRVSKQMNMYSDDDSAKDSFKEILRGFVSIIKGLASLSNKIADRHATIIHPQKHHAKIVVNSSMILSEFLLESLAYQNTKKKQ